MHTFLKKLCAFNHFFIKNSSIRPNFGVFSEKPGKTSEKMCIIRRFYPTYAHFRLIPLPQPSSPTPFTAVPFYVPVSISFSYYSDILIRLGRLSTEPTLRKAFFLYPCSGISPRGAKPLQNDYYRAAFTSSTAFLTHSISFFVSSARYL